MKGSWIALVSATFAMLVAAIPRSSVKTAGSGLKIDIVGVSPDRGSYKVRVSE